MVSEYQTLRKRHCRNYTEPQNGQKYDSHLNSCQSRFLVANIRPSYWGPVTQCWHGMGDAVWTEQTSTSYQLLLSGFQDLSPLNGVIYGGTTGTYSRNGHWGWHGIFLNRLDFFGSRDWNWAWTHCKTTPIGNMNCYKYVQTGFWVWPSQVSIYFPCMTRRFWACVVDVDAILAHLETETHITLFTLPRSASFAQSALLPSFGGPICLCLSPTAHAARKMGATGCWWEPGFQGNPKEMSTHLFL